jgi:hypothetical protein
LTEVNKPVSGTVAANDSDPDHTAAQLVYAKVTNPTNGTVTQNADGTYTYTPTTGYIGNDSYTYKVCDPLGKCDTATVTIAILPPAATPPTAVNDIASTPQDKPVSGNVLTNDDGTGPLTVTSTPTTPPSKGTVVLNPNGTFTYTPTPGVTGEDKFCYELKDANGLKDTACVVIEIVPNPTPTNDAPIAVDDNTETPKNTPVVIVVKANDSDPEGLPLGTPTAVTPPTNGAVVYNTDGTVTYTPNNNFVGTDTFVYKVCDTGVPSKCDSATVTVVVKPTPPAGNQPPVAMDDATLTEVNKPVSGTVAANDSDPDHTAAQLVYAKVTNPTNGTVTQNADGTYTYTPTTGYIGNDSYTYKVCDPLGKCDTATVTIAILPPAATPPTAVNDIASTPQDKPVSGNVLTNDDGTGPLTVTSTPTTPPSKGTVVLNPNGTFTYTPTPGVTGEDKFCYELKDANGLKDTACVVIEIVPNPTPTNDAPIAVDDNTETPKNTPVVIVVKANDSDPEGCHWEHQRL